MSFWNKLVWTSCWVSIQICQNKSVSRKTKNRKVYSMYAMSFFHNIRGRMGDRRSSPSSCLDFFKLNCMSISSRQVLMRMLTNVILDFCNTAMNTFGSRLRDFHFFSGLTRPTRLP